MSSRLVTSILLLVVAVSALVSSSVATRDVHAQSRVNLVSACRTTCSPATEESSEPSVDAKFPEAADELFEKFESAKTIWQQADVARALVSLGDPKIIPAIEKHLNATDRRRRCNAGLVLAGLADERGLAAIIRELEDKAPRPTDLIQSDGRPSPESQIRDDRYYAALLLGQLRDQGAVQALIEATTDNTINDQAAISLGEIGDKRAIPSLRKMGAAFPDQKLWAGYGLAALGEQEGFDLLAESALSDSRWTQRRHAVEALGKMGDSKMVPTVVRALQDKHVNVRASAAVALGQIGDPAALPALTAALKDTEATQINAPTSVAAQARKAIEAIRDRK